MWMPISLAEIQAEIRSAEQQMSDSERGLWRMLAIPPEEWQLSPWGDEGEGFWVVAIAGKRCVYYNDIEGGFNDSPFRDWGTIDDYCCNQDQLQWPIGRWFRQVLGEPDNSPLRSPPLPLIIDPEC